jgi:hypothetical protein
LERGSHGRERGEVDRRGFAQENLCHEESGGRSQEDAVAVVASGEEMVGMAGKRAEKRKAVGSSGTEACPGFELRGCGQRRK